MEFTFIKKALKLPVTGDDTVVVVSWIPESPVNLSETLVLKRDQLMVR